MKSKILHVVLSVVLAFALWLYVVTVVSPESEETYYDIPVTYQNDVLDERGLMIVSDTPTVTVRSKGNRSDLNELNANNITVLVDLASIQAPGTQMLSPNVIYPGNMAVETLSQNPSILQLKVENKIKKPVGVRLEYLGSVPEGFIADKENPVMDYTTVEVSGPESAISKIDHALIQIDLNNQTESVIGQFTYTLCDTEGNPVDAEMVTTNVENVNLSVKIQRMKEVPLVLNVVDGGGATEDNCDIQLSHETIWVSGSESKLRDLTAVELGTVNLAELREETNTLVFDVVLPDGVTNTSGLNQVTATISFPELGKKKMTIGKEQFRAAGIPTGVTVTWITEVLEIEVRGPRDLIKNITEKDVTITVDFTDENLGSVSKMPKVTFGSQYAGVGAVTIPTLTANLQMEPTDGATR